MGFNLGMIGAAFRGQQEYDEYLQAKKMRDMQLAQMEAQNDPKALAMAWDAQMNAGGQPPAPPMPAPMPGQASVPNQPMPQAAPQMPQGGPQQGAPMPPQGMAGQMPPAAPVPPYRALNADGPQGSPQGLPRGAVPGDDGSAPVPSMPSRPMPQAAGMPEEIGKTETTQPGLDSQAPTGQPVQLKHGMTLKDVQQFIQQHYGNATPAQKFSALEKVHGYMSADAKAEFQIKTLEQKEKFQDALTRIKEMQAVTDQNHKKELDELNKKKEAAEEQLANLRKAQAFGATEKGKVQGQLADAATTRAGAAVTSANASASRAATAATNAASDGADKLTPEGRAVRDARALAGLPTFKAKRGQIDYDLYNSLGKNPNSKTDVVVKPAEYKANASSLAATQKRADAIELGSRKIPLDINTMLGTIGKGSAGSWQVTNSPINALRTKFSDPDLRKFALAVRQVGTEYERLLTGGMLSSAQLHAGAAEDAKKILNEDMSPEEIKAIIPIMLQEIKNAKTASNEELKVIKDRMRGKNEEAQGALPSGWSVKEH